jgi:hypothetical protein
MLNEVKNVRYDFLRRIVLSTSTPNEGWLQEKTGSPPDIASYNGALEIKVNETSQAQANRACFGNDLPFRIQDIKEIRFVAAADTFGALVEAAFGICDAAPADDPDSTAQALQWRVDADNAVSVECDDAATHDVAVSTGQTLGTTFKRFVIDFTGGKSNVKFYIDGERVCSSTTFDMSAYSSGLQPIIQLQKAANNNADVCSVDYVRIVSKRG